MSDRSKTQQQLVGFAVGVVVAGAAAAGVILSRQPAAPPPPPAPMPPPAAAAVMPPPSTPRDEADRRFNEVMMAVEGRDTEGAALRAPGALAAYQALPQLDDDARYHVALLQLAAGRFDDARQSAGQLLAANPQHLLGLAISMRCAAAAKDAAGAADLARRFLGAYDAELARGLPEYQDHQRVLPTYRTEAEALLKGP